MALTRSWVALLATCVVLAVIVAVVGLETRRLQGGLRALERAHRDEVAALERMQGMLAAAFYDQMKAVGRLNDLSTGLVPGVVRHLLVRGDALDAHALATRSGSLDSIGLATLRRLRSQVKERGYLVKALELADACAERSGEAADRDEARKIQGSIAVLSGAFVPALEGEEKLLTPHEGRVLHIVTNSMPITQSGYTIRTHYTAVAQRDAGIDPHVATQTGYGISGDRQGPDVVDGITYHRVPGPGRGTKPFDVWLGENVRQVAQLVRTLQPTTLHAASNFINALTAEVIGKHFGIPVVYESRGFWEESWLARQAEVYGWDDLARLEAEYGLPDEYHWRKEIEDRCRRGVDRVVTLAEVMADRIEAGGVTRDHITVVPNAVDAEAFPVLTRNVDLAAKLGIAPGTTVIGYITTIAGHESIETLLAAYAEVKKSSSASVALLIVGDGPERKRLMEQAVTLGIEDAIFTGRVPHDTVLDYYSVIDIFVVPRKPVEVCHLVTPLKPFEAFSTGRTVVLSNVRALAEIARNSGAAELFEAGDPKSLASVLCDLLERPQRRAELAQTGVAWVRADRTWAVNARAYVRLYEDLGG